MPRWPTRTFAERLHAKIDASGGPDACHTWTAAKNAKGYGHLILDRQQKFVYAHRAVWEERHGPIGALMVLHKCDNPSCCNINHLFVGTNSDNVRDMLAKGRKTLRGKRCVYITPTNRAAMRALRAQGVFIRTIARQFGASYGATRTALMGAA